jgi:hypothetical protein
MLYMYDWICLIRDFKVPRQHFVRYIFISFAQSKDYDMLLIALM